MKKLQRWHLYSFGDIYFYSLHMLGSGEKKFNKWLVGFIIGGTILGITGLSKTEKGRGIIGRALESVRTLLKTFLDAAEHLGEKVASKNEEGKHPNEKL